MIAASRARQIYLATLLHTLGARVGAIGLALHLEYLLLALLTTAFATAAGSALAAMLLHYRLELDVSMGWMAGGMVAALVSGGALSLGAHYLMRHSCACRPRSCCEASARDRIGKAGHCLVVAGVTMGMVG